MPRSSRLIRSCPPLPFQKAEGGICRACGNDILRKDGERHKGRRWCEKHRLDGRIMMHAVFARAAVFMRDMGVCCDCGRDCTSYETLGYGDVPRSEGGMATYLVQINREKALEWCKRILTQKQNPRNPQSAYLIDLGEWDVDHGMPIHLIDRSDPNAWRQWTLDNLFTRCTGLVSCHQEKSTKEAKVRAKIRRITGANKPKIKHSWPKGRKIPSRPMRKRA